MQGPGEFRAVWFAAALSIVGDQLARVALASLVWDQTQSALWTAAAWGLTFLPAIVGGIWLGHLADRYPRRQVLVATDLLRALLIGAMALPGLPLWLMCVLVAAAVTLGPLFSAAQGALLPDLLPLDRYERGLAALQITNQLGQVVGFAAAGALVAVIGAPAALLVDAGTFVASAAVLLAGIRARAALQPAGAGNGRPVPGLAAVRVILRDPHRRRLVLLAWLVGCWVVPEGLAVSYVAEHGGGPVESGVLLASIPAGSALGAWLLTHLAPAQRRSQLVNWLAVAGGAPLLATVWMPNFATVVALWLLSGACVMAYLTQANADFVRATPPAVRGQSLGAVGAGMIASQGVALVGAGALAELVGTTVAIGIAGALGAVLAAIIVALPRTRGSHVKL